MSRMMGIPERLSQLIKELNVGSPGLLAKKAGVPRQTIERAFKTASMSPETAEMLAEGLGVRPEWILFGVGDICLSSDLYAYIPKAKSKISAGGGTFPEEEFEEKRYGFLRSWLGPIATAESNLYLIDIEGDSMEPTLKSGDTVLIDRGRTDLVAGAIFALRSDSVTLIKRIALLASGKVLIKSDNPMYPPEEVWAGDITVKGRMIWSARSWI